MWAIECVCVNVNVLLHKTPFCIAIEQVQHELSALLCYARYNDPIA